MKYAHFDFLVEDMTLDEADRLLEIIVLVVEAMGKKMGGGVSSESDDDHEADTGE